jgi:hypothetical protein
LGSDFGFRLAVLATLAVALSSGCSKRPPASLRSNPPVASTPRKRVDAGPLTRELVRRLETIAGSVDNECSGGRWLVSALPHTQGADRERVMLAVKSIVARAEPNRDSKDCLHHVGAELIPYLPRSEQPAAVDRIVDLVESKEKGWVWKYDLVRAVAGIVDRQQVARLERYASADTHCCIQVVVRAILARSRQFPAGEALRTAKACRKMCGGDADILQVLPLVDMPTRLEFLGPRLKPFDEPPGSWNLGELYTLAAIAPFLEERRRHALLALAFRRMPELGVEPDNGGQWGEISPPGHYFFILEALAPFVTPHLVARALNAVPSEWSPEIRSQILGPFAAALPPEVRRRSLSTILDALPGPDDSLHFVRTRLLLAADLPEDEVRTLFRRFFDLEKNPRERAEVSARLFGVSSGMDRAELERTFLRELESIDSVYDRARTITTALEHLN